MEVSSIKDRKKEVKKMSKYSEFLKQRKTNGLDFFLGEGNYKTTNNRFQIKNYVLDNDTILLITNNVQYFSNKEIYVLWIAEDKVVYLKSWQVKEVYNFEHLGDCYIVKLNRQYFKPYQCFKNDFLMIEKEYTFDDLLEVTKSQTGNCLWFK